MTPTHFKNTRFCGKNKRSVLTEGNEFGTTEHVGVELLSANDTTRCQVEQLKAENKANSKN
jgi:hypothetical protein